MLVELVDGGGHRQARAVALGLGKADGEVLAHPVHGEAEIELIVDHRPAAIVHLPGPGRALGNDLQHERHVEARLEAHVQRLGQALQQAGDRDLVHHLGELPVAGRAQQRHRAAVAGHGRPGALEGLAVAAAHHGQHAVLRARLAAGDGRIDAGDAAVPAFRVKFARKVGGSGGVVHINRARPDAGEDAVIAVNDAAHIVVIAHAGEHDVRARRRLAGRGGRAAAVGFGPSPGLLAGAVIDGDLVAGRGEMPRHREAHDAEADECKRSCVHGGEIRIPGTAAIIAGRGGSGQPRSGARCPSRARPGGRGAGPAAGRARRRAARPRRRLPRAAGSRRHGPRD